MNILITGRPGTGKTTLLNKIKDSLESKEHIIGGVYCPEIRKNEKRVGFSIINIMNKNKGILSHINCSGPRVGKYKVNLKDLNEIGVSAIKKAIKKADYIFIDEIAPMELYSEKFIDAVETAFNNEKPVLAVIHRKSNHPFIKKTLENCQKFKEFLTHVKNFQFFTVAKLSVLLASKIFDFRMLRFRGTKKSKHSKNSVFRTPKKSKIFLRNFLSVKDRNDVLIFEISPENRDLIYKKILNALEM